MPPSAAHWASLLEAGEWSACRSLRFEPLSLRYWLWYGRPQAAKNDANAKFKDKHYVAAVDGYTRAIELDPTNAVYYGDFALLMRIMFMRRMAWNSAERWVESVDASRPAQRVRPNSLHSSSIQSS